MYILYKLWPRLAAGHEKNLVVRPLGLNGLLKVCDILAI